MRLALSTLVLALVAPACSTTVTNGSPGNGVTTSVSSAKEVDSLSDADAQTLCKDAMAWVNQQLGTLDMKRVGCNFQGNFAAMGIDDQEQARAACKKASDQCMTEADPATTTTTTPTKDNCTEAHANFQKCAGTGLTVADLTACTEESMVQIKKLADANVCATLSPNSSTSQVPTPKCDAVKAKCPALNAQSSQGS